LKPSNAILAEDKHAPIYEEMVSNYKVEYSAGGAAQNTARAVTWMLQTPNVAVYVGCIGNDEFGTQLEQAARAGNVNVQYLKDPEAPTGTCACLIVDSDRSLVARLGAANNYQHSHYESQAIQGFVKNASHFYATGFFLTVSPQTLVSIGEYANANNKTFVLNLAAPFIIDFFTEKLDSVLPYADYVIGNEHEGAAFGKKYFNTDDLKETARGIAKLKKNSDRPRIAIITHGSNPVIVAVGDEVTEYPVPALEQSLIIDANGAGDCFVGGFLSGLLQGKEMVDCVKAGCVCAQTILQVGGVVFKGTPPSQ